MIRSLFRSHDGTLVQDLPLDRIPEALADSKGLLWLDVVPTGEDVDAIAALFRQAFRFHPLALEDALQQSHVPRLDDWHEYLYIVLHAVGVAPNRTAEFHELDVFLGRNYLVTVHEDPVAPLEHVWDQCRQGAEHRLAAGPDHLLYVLADGLVADYLAAADRLDEEISRIEGAVFHHPSPSVVRRIFRTRRTLLRVRRLLGSLREVLNRLARDDYAVVGPERRLYFRDVYDHLVRLYDIVEGLRDMAAGALESYLSVTSTRLNEVMRTLTVVSVLFLPVSFLASFFGMNFFGETLAVHVPIAAPVFFWVCLALMVATPLAMLRWMARRGMLHSFLQPDEGTEQERAGR